MAKKNTGMVRGKANKARKKLKPVSIWGIEFDALIDETKNLSATIPTYPVENGFPVSDTIILEPISIQMTLYVSNTPVTWLYRHGSSTDRVNKICDLLEKKWLKKQLAKIVTTEAIYKDMGITSISIKKSHDIGYAREVSISAQKVRITKRKTVKIPSYVLKSGETKANAGTASTSTSSSKSSTGSGNGGSGGSGGGGGSSSSGGSGSSGSSGAKKGQSILYGAASGLGLI